MARPNKSPEHQRFDEILGGYLRERRVRRGYSLQESAEALGVSPETLGGWERGAQSITAFHLVRWCERYDVTLDPYAAALDWFNIWYDSPGLGSYTKWLAEQHIADPRIPLRTVDDYGEEERGAEGAC